MYTTPFVLLDLVSIHHGHNCSSGPDLPGKGLCDGNVPIYFSDGGSYCDRRANLVEESWIEHEHATLLRQRGGNSKWLKGIGHAK